MKTPTARRFTPVFVATITATSVATKVSKNGADYLISPDAEFLRDGQPAQRRTVMAFGQSVEKVRDLLVPGEPVELAVQFDGGTIKALGAPRPKQKAANPANDDDDDSPEENYA